MRPPYRGTLETGATRAFADKQPPATLANGYLRTVSYPDGLFVIDRPPGSGYLEPENPDPTGPTVVLVHGTLDRANSFRRSIRRLDDLRVVAYDRRGYQDSRGEGPPVGVQGHIEDLLGVLEEIGGASVVVGHSLGGLVALGAAMAEPGRFASVGAFEPPIRWIPVEGRPEHGWGMGEQAPDEAVESFFRRQIGDAAWDRLEPAARADRLADGPALVSELASVSGDALFDVTELKVPVVFGCGGASDKFHTENVAWLTAHVPGAELITIPGAEHGAHLTHPDAFGEFIRAVVARGR
jgi:pimeloyl-ACP methyl ester carboxylesterase